MESVGYGAFVALAIFLVASVWLGTVAQRAMSKGSFMQGYFLGNRGLGAWTLALTATVQSGGTFMGYPSLVYSYGWIVGLWIASYMIVPITGFGILAKRLAQISRRTGAITVPDLFRERFQSELIGPVSSLLIIFFMSFMMVAQFKAGATIMKVVWPDSSAAVAAPAPAAASTAASSATGAASAVASTAPSSATPAPANPAAPKPLDWAFLRGLLIFTLTVVGYTMIGGFLAAVWTDLFQSVLMWVGVMLLFILVLVNVGGMEFATRKAVENTDQILATAAEKATSEGKPKPEVTTGSFAMGPGFSPDGREFLTPGLAFSMFFVWVFSGLGSPATLVRLMACKDTQTIRRSVFLLGAYNFMIYLPLMMICIAARAVMPDIPASASDEVVPRMALFVTKDIPLGTWLSGLVLVAPLGAVMATVSSYLVVIASGVVRDVYQRFWRPHANARELKLLTYAVMIVVGILAFVTNIKPVTYLQAIIVFCGSSAASAFVVPTLMAAFWRRATAAGALSAMAVGAGTALVLLIVGSMSPDPGIGPGATSFRSLYLLGLEPIIWGLSASLVAGVAVSLMTKPPHPATVAQFFDEEPAATQPA